jgi:hypothetical protein
MKFCIGIYDKDTNTHVQLVCDTLLYINSYEHVDEILAHTGEVQNRDF